MARDLADSEHVSRRKFIAGAGAAGLAGLAGCSGDGGETDTVADQENGGGSEPADTDTPADSSDDEGPSLLTGEGSSTVYPIANKGASYWNGNAPPSDGEYWGENPEEDLKVPGWDELDTDKYLADYFAGLYGFEATGQRSNPPYRATIGLSHSGTGCKAVRDELVDIGNSSGPITAELDITEEKAKNNYVDHVVGRDGQPVVVSKDVWDRDIQQLTGDQIRAIYQGEVDNWSDLEGIDYDKEIFVIGRAVGSGTDTSFRLNMLGSADASMTVDTRQGQNQGVAQLVRQNEGAIAYMALAFTGPNVKPIAINFEGTVYKPDKDAENTIFDSDYPLNRDLHMYTRITEETPSGTDRREAAFINMFLTEFGQQVFVTANNYIPLPTKDIEKEEGKLPDQMA